MVCEIERGGRRRCGRRLDERAHGAVAVALESERTLGGLLKLRGGKVAGQAQDALGASERLFGVLATHRLTAQHLDGRGADSFRPRQDPGQTVLDDGDMGCGAVAVAGGAPAAD